MTTKSAKELVAQANREVETLSAEEALSRLGQPDTILVDVREGEELAKTGKIARRGACAARLRGVPGRSCEPDPQCRARRRQALGSLLRLRQPLGPCRQVAQRHGPRPGGPCRWRLPGAGEGRRNRRSSLIATGKAISRVRCRARSRRPLETTIRDRDIARRRAEGHTGWRRLPQGGHRFPPYGSAAGLFRPRSTGSDPGEAVGPRRAFRRRPGGI